MVRPQRYLRLAAAVGLQGFRIIGISGKTTLIGYISSVSSAKSGTKSRLGRPGSLSFSRRWTYRPTIPDRLAGPNGPLATRLANQLALPDRPQSLRRITSCSISLSKLRSATTFQSLLFSSSSCFNRRISVDSRPSHLRFQVKYVA